MTRWPTAELGDLCIPERGITYGIVKVGDFFSDGVPIIRGGDIRDNRIVFDRKKCVSPAVSNQFKRTILQGGEIVINLIAEPGHCAVVPDSMKGANVSRDVAVIPLDGSVDHQFVNYYLKCNTAIDWLTSRLQGSVTQKINLSTLRRVPIPLPPRDYQSSISQVLRALDAKVEGNSRICTAVDELSAQLLNEFISSNFDAPPRVTLGRIASINKSVVTPGVSTHLRYIDISRVSIGTFEWPDRISWKEAPGRARRGVSPGDTIWSTVRPNRRSHALILDDDHELVASTGLAVLTPKAVGPAFLYEVAKRPEFTSFLESVAEGTAYPAVRSEKFSQALVPILPEPLLRSFEDKAMTLRRRAHSAEVESRTLKELRDTLLPKLMSGALRVRDAERLVEDAV